MTWACLVHGARSIHQIRILVQAQILVGEILDPLQGVREIVLRAPAVAVVRGVFVLLAEAEVAHQARGCVAQVHGDGQGGRARFVLEGMLDGGEGAVDARAFGGQRERGDGVGQIDARFGQADLFDRVVRCRAQGQQCVVRHADVFARDHNQSARDVEGRFARGEHASKVVERRRGRRAADGFVEGGDGVV